MEESQSKLVSFAYSLAVAGLVFSMTLGEAIFIHFHKTVAIHNSWGGAFLFYGSMIICGLISLPIAILIWRLPRQRLLVLFSSLALVMFVEFRFRGSFIWSGTFDIDKPGLTTMAYPLIGAILLALVYSLIFKNANPNLKALSVTVGSIAIGAILASTIDAFTNKWIVSEFAFTRHLAIYGLIVAVPSAAFMMDRYQDEL